MFRNRYRHPARWAAIALLALMAGQFAVAGHAVVAEHGQGETCDICVSGERLAHGLTPFPATVAPTKTVLDPPPADVAPWPVLEIRCRLARAPPVSD